MLNKIFKSRKVRGEASLRDDSETEAHLQRALSELRKDAVAPSVLRREVVEKLAHAFEADPKLRLP